MTLPYDSLFELLDKYNWHGGLYRCCIEQINKLYKAFLVVKARLVQATVAISTMTTWMREEHFPAFG
jgi:hypothetical protein